MLKTQDVIDQLNECNARSMGFPCLGHGYFYLADVRLSVFREQDNWAIVIETLVFDNRAACHECFNTILYCYGGNLAEAAGVSRPDLNVTGDGPSGPLFDADDIMGQLISASATDMTIRGKVVPVTTDPAKYAVADIELCDPPRVQGYELLRLLAPIHRRLLFASEAEIARRIGRQMPLLLRLDEWRHPDSYGGERPSDVETFQMIADVLAANDPELYQPTELPNTHWSNWPMGGSL